MTVTHYGNQQYYGLSTDTKPLATDTAINAIFEETDTRNQYINSGTAWVPYQTARTKAGDPIAAEVPAGQSQIWKNTTSGAVKLWYNDAGTMKSTTLA